MGASAVAWGKSALFWKLGRAQTARPFRLTAPNHYRPRVTSAGLLPASLRRETAEGSFGRCRDMLRERYDQLLCPPGAQPAPLPVREQYRPASDREVDSRLERTSRLKDRS